MIPSRFSIIDISRQIDESSACFPGDRPFERMLTLSLQNGDNLNLSALRMSPHVGTHADTPLHIFGDMNRPDTAAGQLPLAPYIGKSAVIDIADCKSEVRLELVAKVLGSFSTFPERVLIRTASTIRHDRFEADCAYLSVELIRYLASKECVLAGIDTPSVDHTESKTLPAHKALIECDMSWLENLDLTQVHQGEYFLIALPLKFMQLEASPVRAVLLCFEEQD